MAVTTLRDTLERWKPAASARTHLLLAASMWCTVGTLLAAAGLHWCLGTHAATAAFLVALGLVLGALKGRFVLARTARHNAGRLVARGDGRCVGGFLGWKGWLLVPLMMGLGIALRRSPLPRPVLGVVYVAIGAALLTGSRPLWRARSRVAHVSNSRS